MESGLPTIVRGNCIASEIINWIKSTDLDQKMPQEGTLTHEEIVLIK